MKKVCMIFLISMNFIYAKSLPLNIYTRAGISYSTTTIDSKKISKLSLDGELKSDIHYSIINTSFGIEPKYVFKVKNTTLSLGAGAQFVAKTYFKDNDLVIKYNNEEEYSNLLKERDNLEDIKNDKLNLYYKYYSDITLANTALKDINRFKNAQKTDLDKVESTLTAYNSFNSSLNDGTKTIDDIKNIENEYNALNKEVDTQMAELMKVMGTPEFTNKLSSYQQKVKERDAKKKEWDQAQVFLTAYEAGNVDEEISKLTTKKDAINEYITNLEQDYDTKKSEFETLYGSYDESNGTFANTSTTLSNLEDEKNKAKDEYDKVDSEIKKIYDQREEDNKKKQQFEIASKINTLFGADIYLVGEYIYNVNDAFDIIVGAQMGLNINQNHLYAFAQNVEKMNIVSGYKNNQSKVEFNLLANVNFGVKYSNFRVDLTSGYDRYIGINLGYEY